MLLIETLDIGTGGVGAHVSEVSRILVSRHVTDGDLSIGGDLESAPDDELPELMHTVQT